MQKVVFFGLILAMDITTILISIFLSILPISELRGAIPYAMANDIPLIMAYPLCVGFNALVSPLVFLFLSTFHKLFLKMSWYDRFFEKFVEKARIKVQSKVERFGYLGIMLFVAIPLPITGAYTGTLGAWILGMSRRKTILAALGGVIISGIIVSLVITLGLQAFSLFIKQV